MISAWRARFSVLQGLVVRHGADGFSLDPLIRISAAVVLPRLRCLLDVCHAFSQQLEVSGQPFNSLPFDASLVCFPYLKIHSWRFCFKHAGRTLSLRQSPSIQKVVLSAMALHLFFVA